MFVIKKQHNNYYVKELYYPLCRLKWTTTLSEAQNFMFKDNVDFVVSQIRSDGINVESILTFGVHLNKFNKETET